MINFTIPQVIAHRGASGYAPENTLSAMIKARELDIDWVEFDVMLSGCGEPIIFHDTRLDRTTNGSGEVALHPYAGISQLDAGSWFSADFEQHRVPSLEQMLQCLKEHQLKAVIEIKPYPGFEITTAQKTFKMVQQLWPDGLDNIIFSSFSMKSLKAIRKLCPQQKLGFGMHHWRGDWQQQVEKLACISIHVNQRILNAERVKLLKQSNKILLSYTVNEPAHAQELFNMGVDGIFTDYPDMIPTNEIEFYKYKM